MFVKSNYTQVDTSKMIGLSIYSGFTYHALLDRSVSAPTTLSPIDSRLILNTGLDLRIFPISFRKMRIFTSIKAGLYKVKVSNPSSSLGDPGKRYNHLLGYSDIGVGLIFKSSQLSSLSINPTLQIILKGDDYTRGTVNYGFSMGYERKVNKLKIGIEYYQRLYFTGFNREIARVMLRVGF